MDQTQSKRVLAAALREAYADIFQINKNANELSTPDLRNKLKTLTQGQYSDSVLDKMVGTFKALAQQADFSATVLAKQEETPEEKIELPGQPRKEEGSKRQIDLSGLGLQHTAGLARRS